METYSIKPKLNPNSNNNNTIKIRRPITSIFLIIIYIIGALAITYWITPLLDTLEFVKLLPSKCINEECKTKYELKTNRINYKLNRRQTFKTPETCKSTVKEYLLTINDVCKSNVCQCNPNTNTNTNGKEPNNCWTCINPELIIVCKNMDNLMDEVDKKCSIENPNKFYTERYHYDYDLSYLSGEKTK